MTPVQPDIAIVGTTASGKSALAFCLAEQIDRIEIVSVDSMQVYRGMDIGTAKPGLAERNTVPHHMVDLVEATEVFDLAEFTRQARQVVSEIHSRGNRVVFVGGTGLYFQAVVDCFELPGVFPEIRQQLENESNTRLLFSRLADLDRQASLRIEPDNRRRIIRALEVTLGTGRQFSSFGPGIDDFPSTEVRIIGLWLPRAINAVRIEQRVDTLIANGWIDEVKALHSQGLSRTAARALGYEQLARVADGDLAIDDARAEIVARTKAFARRQRMWFRRDPRIAWYATTDTPDSLAPAILRDLTAGHERGVTE